MTGPDFAELHHTQACPNCGIRLSVPITECRLERTPWRLEWRCQACSRTVRVRLDKRLTPMLRGYDRPGGTVISVREIRDFVEGMEAIEAFIAEELLSP